MPTPIEIFEELAPLHKDPSAFEKKTEELIERIVSDLPEENKRKAKQFFWRSQAEGRRIKDPIARMNWAVSNFWEGVGEFQSVLNGENLHNKAEKN